MTLYIFRITRYSHSLRQNFNFSSTRLERRRLRPSDAKPRSVMSKRDYRFPRSMAASFHSKVNLLSCSRTALSK
ncbi:unnamed protein product [Hymenolepis diminuta]|uniref:Uncharacterized protein n=1 Tax=Hymenolepis diminuta TaxID=6216 RepID=A0A564Y1T3_HYMDI|nr:unnamed protein product [Hymenolepis diminuta]